MFTLAVPLQYVHSRQKLQTVLDAIMGRPTTTDHLQSHHLYAIWIILQSKKMHREPLSLLENAEVYTSDGKSAGRIVKVNKEYFTSSKGGLVSDEEYRIPLDAISYIESATGDMIIVRLKLNENQLKHGYEFVKGKPNSEFVSGRAESEPKFISEKPLIHYEAIEPLEENISLSSTTEGLPKKVEYSCDMCNEKFDDTERLEEHRGKEHKGPVGI
jgi:sporulation protein YlmC with PRC-barrel domain